MKQRFLLAILLMTLNLSVINARVSVVDPFTENSIRYVFGQDALSITYVFDQDVSAFDQSTISYHKIKGGMMSPDATPKAFDNKNGNTIVFSIPATFYNDADNVEFFITLKKSDGVVFTSPKNSFDVAVQNRLRKILANQPGFVRFNQKLIEADDRIGVRFVTDKPGKIRVTISGLGGFAKNQTSRKIDTIHDFVFDGLAAGQPFTFKAEALQVDDDTQPLPGVTDDPGNVGIDFHTTNNGAPTVTLDNPRIATDNVVFTVRSNQEVFAEISYTPISQTGVPDIAKRKQIGTINCDPVTGGCSGAESVPAGNTPKNFTIPNLASGGIYKIELTFKNGDGKRALLPISEYTPKLPTPAPPTTAFDFAESPISAKITPLGIEVKWSATDTPVNADARYLRDDSSILTGGSKATISGKDVTVTFPPEDVVNIINFQKAATLQLTMDKGGVTLKRAIKFSFALPTKQQVQQSTVSQGVKDAALKLIDAKDNNKSFKWADVLKAGLSIFLGVL
jgi:hypothetical protein